MYPFDVFEVILAFNNLHSNASTSFGRADVDALAEALETFLGSVGVALFFQDSALSCCLTA